MVVMAHFVDGGNGKVVLMGLHTLSILLKEPI
jgi:hypothetical protein